MSAARSGALSTRQRLNGASAQSIGRTAERLSASAAAPRPAMIAEATASARTGAQQFAHDAKTELGGIRSATQGSFEILGRDEIGIEAAPQVFKKLRVVTTVSYQLR